MIAVNLRQTMIIVIIVGSVRMKEEDLAYYYRLDLVPSQSPRPHVITCTCTGPFPIQLGTNEV